MEEKKPDKKVTIIVGNPRTGFILALANNPTFNLNAYNKIPKDQQRDLRNIAVSDVYEPGSVFKIVAASGALNEGLVTPATTFDCTLEQLMIDGVMRKLPGEMIGDLVYSPGGFGVEWGKASGGVVEVTSREGGNQLAGFADVSFINASTMLQGPIGKNGNFAIAVRRSYVDAVIGAVVPSGGSLSFTALPRYYDYQARADYRLSPHLKLDAFLIGSDDAFGVSSSTPNPDDPAMSQ